MSRVLPPALQAALDSGAASLCRCWRLDRRDGSALGLTDHDEPLTFDGLTFRPAAVNEAGALDMGLGLAPTSTELQGALSSESLTESDLSAGLYDEAEVRLWLVDWSNPGEARALIFRGSLGEVSRGSLGFQAELRGLSHRLNQPFGRAYLLHCDAEFCDSRCGLNPAAHQHAASLSRLEPDGSFRAAELDSETAGLFAGGVLEWTSGANAGRRQRLRSHMRDSLGARLEFWTEPPVAPSPGDAFTILPGCDKAFATCRDRFANQKNFRGFPHMPGDDWLTSYPRSGEPHDGRSRFTS
ncbi:DUF2163 domain-containing protein [Neomegalonema sp.]|uniref:DUF2163 domain-containing protein n=1 Tax=Neomegalonema sp. TaxID=2039713 RepID=UPI0026159ACE|nr:DUF2163 domain-containing protein [Neomegalonema sp.]MDD2869104.1 DUF2163 domain-containing protein [Neomegalonema sp.]